MKDKVSFLGSHLQLIDHALQANKITQWLAEHQEEEEVEEAAQVMKRPSSPAQVRKMPSSPAQVMKRPSSPAQVMKRPSSATQVLKKPAAKKAKKDVAADDDDDNDEASDKDSKADETSDDNQRVKRRFVNRNLSEFSQEFQQTWKKLSGVNQKKLLQAVEKDGRNYVLNEKSPVLQQVYTTMEQKSAGSMKEAVPKAVMQATLGGKEAFEQALEEGDIVAVAGPQGKVYYTFEKFYIKESKKVTKGGVVQKDKKVTEDQITDVEGLLKEFKFSFDVPTKEKKAGKMSVEGEIDIETVEAWTPEAKAKLESGIAAGQQLQSCVKDLLQKQIQESTVAQSLKEQLSAKQGELLKAVQNLQDTELEVDAKKCTMAQGKINLAKFCKVPSTTHQK